MNKGGELVMLKEFFNPLEASMVRGLLQSHGIECFAFDDYVHSALRLEGLGGTRVMIHADNLEQAQNILAQINTEAENSA